MDQDIFTKLQDLVCILHELNRLFYHIDCVHNYKAHTKILSFYTNLVLILNHQSSQCIKENPCNNRNLPLNLNE